MKISTRHYNKIKSTIDKLIIEHDEKLLIDAYNNGKFIRSDKVKDLQKRFCFDLFYACKFDTDFIYELYEYLNDEHIFTALKRICPKVTRNY